jgi:hypothetical protein
VSAHRKAHTQVRPDNSFSYFFERNLVCPLTKSLSPDLSLNWHRHGPKDFRNKIQKIRFFT